jgi:hypothetical protein
MALPAPPVRPDGLQLEDRRALQRRFWTFQRVALVVLGLVVAAAALGFTGGGGYFSRQTVTVAETSFDLPRVSRWEDSDEIRIVLGANAGGLLRLGGDFSGSFKIESVQPEPAAQRATARGLEVDFSDSSGGEVVLGIRPSGPGLPLLTLEAGGEQASVRILILP